MGNYFFSPPLTNEERLSKMKRTLDRAVSEIVRSRTHMQRQEPQIIREIKQMASNGQKTNAQLIVKDLRRHRKAIESFYKYEIQLKSTIRNLQMVKSTATLAEVMRDTTKVLRMINAQCNLPELKKMMKEFEKQNDTMESKQEIMDETIDSVMEGDDDSVEEKAFLDKIMDEIGVTIADKMENVKSKPLRVDDKLQKRINNLKK
jgi:charged multivesicular body protein 2A